MSLFVKNQKTLTFRKLISKGSKETIKHEFVRDCRITEMKMRFYGGQELDLEIEPVLMQQGLAPLNLVQSAVGGSVKIAGDNDYFEFNLGAVAYRSDELIMYAENLTDPSTGFDYNMVVDMTIEW